MSATRFVFVSPAIRDAFLKEWRAIDSRYQPFTHPPEGMSIGEHWDNVSALRLSARQELRDEVRKALAQGFGGGNIPLPL
jgi:hypothetical protein